MTVTQASVKAVFKSNNAIFESIHKASIQQISLGKNCRTYIPDALKVWIKIRNHWAPFVGISKPASYLGHG